MRGSRRLVARFIVTVFLAGMIALPGLAGEQEMLTLMRRITALAQEGRYGEAIALARKLTNEAERASGRQSPLTATTLIVLAQALQAQGEMAEAETVLRKALAIREKALGPNHPDVAAVVATLGQIAFSQNRLKDAELDASRAIAIDEGTLGRDNLNTALARMQLGNVRHRQLREAEALDIYSHALEVFKRASGPADIMVPVALNNIAEVYKAKVGCNLPRSASLKRSLFRKSDTALTASTSVQRSIISENSDACRGGFKRPSNWRDVHWLSGKRRSGPIMPTSPPALTILPSFSPGRAGLQKPKACLFVPLLFRKRRSDRITRMWRLH